MRFLKRFGGTVAVVAAVAVLFLAGFSFGFRAGESRPKTVIVQGVGGTENGQPESVDFGTFWQAWETIRENYLKDKDITNENKVYGAIRGLVGSLGDPYSVFFSPEDNKKFQEDIQGNFSGIGAEIGIRDGQLLIIAPLKGTPAERAGLRAGDFILTINATSTDGLTVDKAVGMIRGPEKTEVKLSIFRKAWEAPRDFTIVRDVITAPTLDFTMKPDGIAYVQLYSFNANAHRLFYAAMIRAAAAGTNGVVLDLRNNPGGYLEVAVELAGWFLPRGTLVVSETGRSGVIEELRAEGNTALADIPVVLLVNNGSASASEILAGALRDQRKAKLVGETTFGKGTVQQILPLRGDASLKITVAHWVLPSGKVLDHDGLVPDYEVKPSEEDIKSKNDVQLTKALEVMREILR